VRIARTLALSALVATMASCDSETPSRPTPAPTPATSAPVVRSLYGSVTEPVRVEVEGATVTIVDGPGRGRSTQSGPGGQYEFLDVGEGRRLTLETAKDGYRSRVDSVELTSAVMELDIELLPTTPPAQFGPTYRATFSAPLQNCGFLPSGSFRRTYLARITQRGAGVGIAFSGDAVVLANGAAGRAGPDWLSVNLYVDDYYGVLHVTLADRLDENTVVSIEGSGRLTGTPAGLSGVVTGHLVAVVPPDLTNPRRGEACPARFDVVFARQ